MLCIIEIIIIVVFVLFYGEYFGMSFFGLLIFGGIGGLVVGMVGKDILSNFFFGIMFYFDCFFSIGDWICLLDRNIEGIVVEIGWWIIKIMIFDNCLLYVLNLLFLLISVENLGWMINCCIIMIIGLCYEDVVKVGVIVEVVCEMLKNYLVID